MRSFKTQPFIRFAHRESLSDSRLCKALAEMEKGQVDADLGGGVVKQRIAREGQGKSGGYRAILCFRKEERAFFVYGFAKKDKESLTKTELKVYKKLAKVYLEATEKELAELLKAGEITEVDCDGKGESQVLQERGVGSGSRDGQRVVCSRGDR